MNRRTRDRIYQRKRRLRRQVMAGRITQEAVDTILKLYAEKINEEQMERKESEKILDGYTFGPSPVAPRTESDIPPEIRAALEAAIAHDNRAGEDG